MTNVTEPTGIRPPASAFMPPVDERGRPDPPVAGDEVATLLGTLERNRAAFAWKCGGLDAAGLGATVGASSVTLGGLLKHLAAVEDHWFADYARGRAPQPAATEVDWGWDSADEDTPERLYALWREAVARSRTVVAEALADGGLETPALRAWPDGRAPNLRRTLVDLIEEYARHTGHADLIREAVDGLVGEAPPEIHPPYEPPLPPDRR